MITKIKQNVLKVSFFVLMLFVSFTWSLSCTSTTLPTKTLVITKADGATVEVKAEIADSDETRMKGFMERTSIPEGTGMLFVFDRDQILSFWMKNTPTALSIAYIDSTGKIRNIFDMTPFSLASVVSTSSCRYALEVPQGWFLKSGITVGDFVDISAFR